MLLWLVAAACRVKCCSSRILPGDGYNVTEITCVLGMHAEASNMAANENVPEYM